MADQSDDSSPASYVPANGPETPEELQIKSDPDVAQEI